MVANRQSSPAMFPGEPLIRWGVEDFKRLLLWAVEQNASDILINSDDVIWLRIYGAMHPCTERVINTPDISAIIDEITGSAASTARIMSADPLDFDYELRVDRENKLLYRANATGTRCKSSAGISLILRANPQHPPKLDTLTLPQEIIDNAFPHDGLILITGVMGSGKTTLIGSILQQILLNENRFVGTFEAPIEFNLTSLQNRAAPIVQANIPQNLPSFAESARNITRRALDVVLVGELRDRETMRGVIEMSEIGVAAYATVHTRSVEETPQRILNSFDNLERHSLATALFSSLRLIVHQRLVPCTDGGRIALREWLVFDDHIRVALMNADNHTEVFSILRQRVNANKSSLLHDAHTQHQAGKIKDITYFQIKKEREILNAYHGVDE